MKTKETWKEKVKQRYNNRKGLYFVWWLNDKNKQTKKNQNKTTNLLFSFFVDVMTEK